MIRTTKPQQRSWIPVLQALRCLKCAVPARWVEIVHQVANVELHQSWCDDHKPAVESAPGHLFKRIPR